jgi:hypothetical protein
MTTPFTPSEHFEQVTVVNALERAGIVFFAVPNGGERNPREAKKLQREGVRAGAPDLVLVDVAPANDRPTMIEMKRKIKARYSPEQEALHMRATNHGWNVIAPPAGKSAQWVLSQLRALGYRI